MVKIFFSLLLLLFPSLLPASELPYLAQKADKLFEIKEYDNSLILFEECYHDLQNTDCISHPIFLLERVFASLPSKSNKSITVYNTNRKEPDSILPFMVIGPILADSSLRPSPGLPIVIKTPEEMEQITSYLQFFKLWLQKLSVIARNCYARDDRQICFDYMKRISNLKKQLNIYYRNLFSYDIASPILARTQQLIFIADTSKSIGVDEDTMRDAAKVLGTLNDEIIRYVNQDVRNQFLDVVKEFREKAGKELTEELKAIQTLQDKFVNNRYTEPIF